MLKGTFKRAGRFNSASLQLTVWIHGLVVQKPAAQTSGSLWHAATPSAPGILGPAACPNRPRGAGGTGTSPKSPGAWRKPGRVFFFLGGPFSVPLKVTNF